MTQPSIKLKCTQEMFEDIHKSVDKVRKNSKTVRVSREALINLLMDHSLLLGELYRSGYEYEYEGIEGKTYE